MRSFLLLLGFSFFLGSVFCGEQFTKGGQTGFFHEYNAYGFSALPGGFFHTYDEFRCGEIGKGATPRKIHIFLPRDYETSQETYPVLYFQDGDTTFYKGGAAGKTWWLAQTIGNLKDKLPKLIVVAIYPVDREYEYTHEFWALSRSYGGLEEYSSYVSDCLKAWIDQNYRTDPRAEVTGVFGSSHGGLASFYIANRRPDKFGIAGCLSSSFWVGVLNIPFGGSGSVQNSKLRQLVDDTLKDSTKRPKLYIDWGLKRDGGFENWDIEDRATTTGRQMRDMLRDNYGYSVLQMQRSNVQISPGNYDLYIVEDENGGHNEDAWADRIWIALLNLYGLSSAPVVEAELVPGPNATIETNPPPPECVSINGDFCQLGEDFSVTSGYSYLSSFCLAANDGESPLFDWKDNCSEALKKDGDACLEKIQDFYCTVFCVPCGSTTHKVCDSQCDDVRSSCPNMVAQKCIQSFENGCGLSDEDCLPALSTDKTSESSVLQTELAITIFSLFYVLTKTWW